MIAGVGWYEAHFAGSAPSQVRVEASACFSEMGPGRVRLVRRLLPRVRAVLLLRCPIELAWAEACA